MIFNKKIDVYHVNAFTDSLFAGNPAAVCILNEWLSNDQLQLIAAEHNLPATAFLVPTTQNFETRWFTPEYEIDLCGHGMLASAFVIFNYLTPDKNEIGLHHPVVGTFSIQKVEDKLVLTLPVKNVEPIPCPAGLTNGLGRQPAEVYQYKNERCMAVFNSEQDIRGLIPKMEILSALPYRGIIVTAPSEEVDFVSRVFYPKKTISEDAMTGSSYCLLAPYWQALLAKDNFHAKQLSQRGGEVTLQIQGDQIQLYGKAVLYMKGQISGC